MNFRHERWWHSRHFSGRPNPWNRSVFFLILFLFLSVFLFPITPPAEPPHGDPPTPPQRSSRRFGGTRCGHPLRKKPLGVRHPLGASVFIHSVRHPLWNFSTYLSYLFFPAPSPPLLKPHPRHPPRPILMPKLPRIHRNMFWDHLTLPNIGSSIFSS